MAGLASLAHARTRIYTLAHTRAYTPAHIHTRTHARNRHTGAHITGNRRTHSAHTVQTTQQRVVVFSSSLFFGGSLSIE